MLGKALIEIVLLLAIVFVIGWGSIKAVFMIRREFDKERRALRQEKADAEDALAKLQEAVDRAATTQSRTRQRTNKEA